jgi:hypothetical protein
MTRSERDPATRWLPCDGFRQSSPRLCVDERTNSVPLTAGKQFEGRVGMFHVKHPSVSMLTDREKPDPPAASLKLGTR